MSIHNTFFCGDLKKKLVLFGKKETCCGCVLWENYFIFFFSKFSKIEVLIEAYCGMAKMFTYLNSKDLDSLCIHAIQHISPKQKFIGKTWVRRARLSCNSLYFSFFQESRFWHSIQTSTKGDCMYLKQMLSPIFLGKIGKTSSIFFFFFFLSAYIA